MHRLSCAKKAGKNPGIGNDGKGAFIPVRYKWQEAVGPISLLDCFLLYCRVKVVLRRIEPHLNESHRLVWTVVDLRMPHFAAYRCVLHPAFLENTAFAALVSMPEFPTGHVCDNLIVPMRVERPDSARCQCIIIKDAKRAKIFELRVVVVTEGKMPPAVESPIRDIAINLVNAFRITNMYHIMPPFNQIKTLNLFFYIISQA